MSMHAACRVLAESRASLKQEEITQGMCKEWIWEFILRHCCDSRLLRAMALAYPVPESRHLKRLLLLRALSFDILERCFTDRTFETLSALYSLYCSEGHRNCYQVTRTDSAGKSYRHRFELWMLCLAVRLECTVQYLRPESDDWPKFYESVEKYWGDLAQDTEEPEFKDDSYNLDNGSYSQLKDKLWAVLKQPELRHDLLRQHKRDDVIEMMESFVSAAWEDVRVTFLESVAHSIEKGLYVSDGLPQKSDCRTKGGLLQIADISPGKSFHARKQKEEIQNSAFVLETGSPDPRKSIPMPHGSLLHQDTGDLSAPKHGHDREPGSSVGLTSKEVGKDLPSSGGHTFQSMTNISDGGIFVRSAIKLDNESTVSLHSRRREMPASLLEGKTGLTLPNSSTNNLQTEKARQLRMDQEIPMPHDSLLHQESGDLSVPKHGHDGQPDSLVGLTSKEVGKGLSSPGGHTSQSMIGVSDGGTSLGSAIKLDNESTVSLRSRRRKMPASLLEGKTGLALPNSSIDNLQLEKAKQLRMTRSSSTESPGAMGMSFENSDRLAAQCPVLEPHTKDFHADHAEETHQDTEKKDEGEDFPSSEQEQAHLSPPLLAGLNGNITIRKKPSVASLPVETDRTIDTSFQKQGLSTPDIVKAQTELRDGQANLSTAVHDPLPEAVQIAEEVAKFCNTAEQEQALVANNGIEVMENLPKKLDSSNLLEKGVQGSHETCRKRSIMERNPTAHTVEWETSDDIADSSDDISPSRSRHVKLPKFQTRQSSCNASRKPLHVEPKRRKFKRWTVEEENILRKEVERYGKGVWKHILSKHRDVFEGRTEVDLKDKWRNIERREGIL